MAKLEMWLSKKEQGSAMQGQHCVCYGAESKDRELWLLVSSSFHVGLSDADHSWQLTQPTCRAFSILKIMPSPLSVQEPPAVLGLSKTKLILHSWGFSFLLFQQHQVRAAQTHTRNTPRCSWGITHSTLALPWAPRLSPHPFVPFHIPLTLTQCKFWGGRAS